MKDIRLDSPLKGKLIALSDVKDQVFSSGTMGRGAAVESPEGKVYAPFGGEITVFFDTKHAIGLKSDDGIEILIHVGMDTVNLKGEHFTAHKSQGDRVKKGDLLLEFDEPAIRKTHDTTTPVVVTNAAEFGKITVVLGSHEIVSEGAGASSEAAVTDNGEFAGLPDEQK